MLTIIVYSAVTIITVTTTANGEQRNGFGEQDVGSHIDMKEIQTSF